MKNKKHTFSNKKIIIVFISLFVTLINTNIVFADNWVCYDSTYDCHVTKQELKDNFPWQPNSKLNKICSGSTMTSTYTPTAFIRDCETSPFLSCPENEYYMRNIFNCIRTCEGFDGAHHTYDHYENGTIVVTCGLGGSPYCDSWSVSENCNEEPTKDYVCGNETNLNNSWVDMTATSWECPTCKELSIRQDEEPILFEDDSSTFQSISMSNYPYGSNTTTDFTFTAYIEACINRVPLLNLNVKLINATGESESAITGIYAKHEELNYSTENLGLLESFIIPEQDEFKKNYTLHAELKGYRPWAWRSRLVDAIPKIINKLGLDIPGYPEDITPQTIGDLYFSADFLGGQTQYDEIDDTCNAEISLTNTYEIDVLHSVPELSDNTMCIITDLNDYINAEGITQELTDYLNTTYSLEALISIDNINIKDPDNFFVSYHMDNIVFDVRDYGFSDSTNFIDFYEDEDNDEKFDYLIDNGIITTDDLQQKSEEQMSTLVNTDKIGCDDYEYQFIEYEATDDIGIKTSEDGLRIETYSLDVLHNLTELEIYDMCTIDDLTDYYEDYGITTSLSDELHDLYSLEDVDIIKSMAIDTPINTPITIDLDDINNFDVTDESYENSTVFKDYTDTLTDEQLFQYLRSIGLITNADLQQKSNDFMSAIVNLPEIGCSSYTYNYGSYTINGNINVNIVDLNHTDISMPSSDTTWINDIITDITLEIKKDVFVEVNITEITTTWINDIITDIEIEFTNEYDCETSWSWGNLGDIDNEDFAKCLYNWDACILSEISGEVNRGWPYYEVADCGMGPPSNLLDTTLKDAARGNKSILTQITVYKTCIDGINWISSEETHTCIDGHTYKCKFDLSNDVITAGIDVTRVDEGYVQVSQVDQTAYICTGSGTWRTIECDDDSFNGTDENNISCLNTGITQGFCGDIIGIYQWQNNPDESLDSCCCTSNGYWDNIKGCCDAGDSWTSTDSKWICSNGVVLGDYTGLNCDGTLNPLLIDVVVTFECDETEINGTKKWWDGTEWVTPAPEYCGCTQKSDCNTAGGETCIENICIIVKDPVLILDGSTLDLTISIPLGETRDVMLKIRNEMNVTDYIEINIDKTYEISNWAWFEGQKNMNPHTKIVSVPPNSDQNVIIEILGGKTGIYTLKIDAESLLTLKEVQKESTVIVIPKINENTGEIVETTSTPGLSWLGFILVMIAGSMIFYRKDNL